MPVEWDNVVWQCIRELPGVSCVEGLNWNETMVRRDCEARPYFHITIQILLYQRQPVETVWSSTSCKLKLFHLSIVCCPWWAMKYFSDVTSQIVFDRFLQICEIWIWELVFTCWEIVTAPVIDCNKYVLSTRYRMESWNISQVKQWHQISSETWKYLTWYLRLSRELCSFQLKLHQESSFRRWLIPKKCWRWDPKR